jgi:transposase
MKIVSMNAYSKDPRLSKIAQERDEGARALWRWLVSRFDVRRLVLVPSSSPDLNPIEQAFSKLKNILRNLGARTHKAWLEAMGEALSEVTLVVQFVLR